jgi:WD40 repeat protein
VIEVSITRLTGDTYRTEVLRSPAGEAAALVKLDVASLTARRERLRRTVLASASQGNRPVDERPLREAGRELFAALLGAENVSGLYAASAAMAAGRGQQLRVVVRTDDPALAGLPWEAMYDEVNDRYVCRVQPLVRQVNVASPVMPLQVDLPLRILAVVSSPTGLEGLDVDTEKHLLTAALARLTDERRADLVWAPSAVWADLHETLLGGPWHVLHFVGHGRLEPGSSEGELALTRVGGEPDWVRASRLVDLLGRARPHPRLVVLNSCSGAVMSTTDMFSSTATALVRRAVSAVVAMQYEFSDPAAAAFTRGFYSELAHGRGVDDAAWSGRTAIIGLNGRTLEWVTPVLYLRADDSQLFVIRADERPISPGGTGAGKAARPLGALGRHAAGVRCLAFGPSGGLLASAGDASGIQLWQVPEASSVRMIPTGPHPVTSLAFSPDGQLLVSASMSARSLSLWETASGGRVRRLTAHAAGVFGVAFSSDGAWLASGGSDHTVRLWTLASGDSQILDGHTGTVRSVAFSPDGAWLASGGSDGTVRLWSLPTGGEVRILRPPADVVNCLAFSPGQSLLAAAAGTAVHLWDPAAGAGQGRLTAHSGLVYGAAFHPRRPLLASAGADGMVRLWDLHTGQQLQRLAGHEAAVTDVKFSPDGRLLASAGADHTVRLWEVPQPAG